MANKCTSTNLKKQLIKSGQNPKSAEKLARKHCPYLNRVYKDTSLSVKAKIAMTLG